MTDLEKRIATMISHRNHYSLVNALLKRGNEDGLRAIGYTDEQIAKLKQPDARGRIGYEGSLAAVNHRLDRAKRKLRGVT